MVKEEKEEKHCKNFHRESEKASRTLRDLETSHRDEMHESSMTGCFAQGIWARHGGQNNKFEWSPLRANLSASREENESLGSSGKDYPEAAPQYGFGREASVCRSREKTGGKAAEPKRTLLFITKKLEEAPTEPIIAEPRRVLAAFLLLFYKLRRFGTAQPYCTPHKWITKVPRRVKQRGSEDHRQASDLGDLE
ncbi:hypothetical protein C8R44DRAFT_751486 [Mycena epipterygia]|nr:hypothetical protein C8R44DRAFT_751486 [Mycena epipterygia]